MSAASSFKLIFHEHLYWSLISKHYPVVKMVAKKLRHELEIKLEADNDSKKRTMMNAIIEIFRIS